jgi:hypothetical protein
MIYEDECLNRLIQWPGAHHGHGGLFRHQVMD